MKGKIVSVLFHIISWSVWAAVIAAIVYAVVLLCTGMEKPPVFTLNAAEVQQVAADDAVLAENGKSGDDWVRVSLDMTVAANKYSPFSYTAASFAPAEPLPFAAQDCFVTVDAPLSYSKIAPDDYVLSLYVRPASPAAVLQALPSLRFSMHDLTGYFVFMKFPFIYGSPSFTLSEFDAALLPAAA